MLKYLKKSYVMSVVNYMADAGETHRYNNELADNNGISDTNNNFSKVDEMIASYAENGYDENELSEIGDEMKKDQEKLVKNKLDDVEGIKQKTIDENTNLLLNTMSHQLADAKLNNPKYANWDIEATYIKHKEIVKNKSSEYSINAKGQDGKVITGIELDKPGFSIETKTIFSPSMMALADKMGITEEMVINKANALVQEELVARQEIKAKEKAEKRYVRREENTEDIKEQAIASANAEYQASVKEIQAEQLAKEIADIDEKVAKLQEKYDKGMSVIESAQKARTVLVDGKKRISTLSTEEFAKYGNATTEMLVAAGVDNMKDFQRMIQLTGKDVDGVSGNNTITKAMAYFQSENGKLLTQMNTYNSQIAKLKDQEGGNIYTGEGDDLNNVA